MFPRLHTATLVGSICVFGGVVLAVQHPLYLVGLFGLLSVCFIRLRAVEQWRPTLIASLFLAVMILAVNLLLSKNGTHLLYQSPMLPLVGRLMVTRENIVFSLVSGLKLTTICSLIPLFGILVNTERGFSFFSRIVPRSTLMVSLSWLIVPRLICRFEEASLAMKMRGHHAIGRGVIGRVRYIMPILKLVLLDALDSAWSISESLHARGYGSGRRTAMSQEKFCTADVLVLTLQLGALSYFISLSRFFPAVQFFPTLIVPWSSGLWAALAMLIVATGAAVVYECESRRRFQSEQEINETQEWAAHVHPA